MGFSPFLITQMQLTSISLAELAIAQPIHHSSVCVSFRRVKFSFVDNINEAFRQLFSSMKSHFIANISPCPTRQLACKSFTNRLDYFCYNKSLDDPESYFLYFVSERQKENSLLVGCQGTFSHKPAPCLVF